MFSSTPKYYCGEEFPAGVKFWRGGWRVLSGTALRMQSDPEFRATINFRRGVEKFKGEVLFIASECNVLIGTAHQKKQMRHFRNARLVTIKDSGHLMFNEKPAQTLGIVRRFLKGGL